MFASFPNAAVRISAAAFATRPQQQQQGCFKIASPQPEARLGTERHTSTQASHPNWPHSLCMATGPQDGPSCLQRHAPITHQGASLLWAPWPWVHVLRMPQLGMEPGSAPRPAFPNISPTASHVPCGRAAMLCSVTRWLVAMPAGQQASAGHANSLLQPGGCPALVQAAASAGCGDQLAAASSQLAGCRRAAAARRLAGLRRASAPPAALRPSRTSTDFDVGVCCT